MPFPSLEYHGNQRYWTREKVIEALAQAAAELNGKLPCLDSDYSRIKKGRLDWPCASRVLFYFHSIARGWLAAGVNKNRVTLHNVAWTPEEDAYLLEHAGDKTLTEIGKFLCRSYGSAKARLNRHHKLYARGNNGFFSAAEVAREFNCPYGRVKDALNSGFIEGNFDAVRTRWEVDVRKLTDAQVEFLKKPKQTRKSLPLDLGDYDKRHGLLRKFIDGKVTRIPVESVV